MFKSKKQLKQELEIAQASYKGARAQLEAATIALQAKERENETLRGEVAPTPCKEGPWCEECSFARFAVDTNADKTVRYCKHDACKNFDQKQ